MHLTKASWSIKPRTYRQRARKDFLSVIKKRKAGRNKIRKAIRKQLGYIQRNLRHIEKLADETGLQHLSKRQYRNLQVVSEVLRQQQQMYKAKDHRVTGRIVSNSQSHLRPIVRGKAGTPIEFGMEISAANVNGLMFIDRSSWDPFNESQDVIFQAEEYRCRYGMYPASIHDDQIYRTRDNRSWYREKGIRLSGPLLGRPPKDPDEKREKKKQARQDELERIAVEGIFARVKRRYSMGRLLTKLAATSETQVAMIMLVMKLEKIRKDLFCALLRCLRILCKIGNYRCSPLYGCANVAA